MEKKKKEKHLELKNSCRNNVNQIKKITSDNKKKACTNTGKKVYSLTNG